MLFSLRISTPTNNALSCGLVVGMGFAQTLVDDIAEPYMTDTVMILPPLFMGMSIPVFYFGVRLMKIRKPRPKKEYF